MKLDLLATSWCTYTSGGCAAPVELLDYGFIKETYRYRNFAYPMAQGQIRGFTLEEWYVYVSSLRISPGKVRLPFVDSFDEALRSLFMTYLFGEFSKLAEMKALATLEGSLKDAYSHQMCQEKKNKKTGVSWHDCASLSKCLQWAIEHDGLPEGLLDDSVGSRRTNALNVIRDNQMHGKLIIETMPWGGIFEAIKGVIEHAFRNHDAYDVHDLLMLARIASVHPITPQG